jgi:hypothetical protein
LNAGPLCLVDYRRDVCLELLQWHGERAGAGIVLSTTERDPIGFLLEDKRQIAENTMAFIDDQLKSAKVELSTVEHNLQNYREKNKAKSGQWSTFNFLCSR